MQTDHMKVATLPPVPSRRTPTHGAQNSVPAGHEANLPAGEGERRPGKVWLRTASVQRGFTLIELAMVMFVVALLIGGMLLPLSAQRDLRNSGDTEKALGEIREALIGFAASHSAADGKPYLPCPDTNDDGVEDRAGNVCTNQEGRIPWVDLGLGQTDAWNNRFRYRVTPAFSNNAIGFALTSTSTLRVCTDSTCAATVATAVPAVIVSHGNNGAGAFNTAGGTNAVATDANELENTDGDNDFVSKTPDLGYDDLVIWLSPNILFSRMLTAGRLP